MLKLNRLLLSRRVIKSSILIVLVTGFFGWIAFKQIYQQTQLDYADILSTTLETTHEGLSLWIDEKKNGTLVWASMPAVQELTKTLLQTQRTKESLIASPAQASLRKLLKNAVQSSQYLGFFIIAPDMISIASMRNQNLGTPNLLADKNGFLSKIFDGESNISLPYASDVPLLDRSGVLREHVPTMFSAAPIKDENGEVIAALAFRINPFKGFSHFASLGQLGESGETYLFNKSGTLITESRFSQQLENLGLISNQYSILSLSLRDPGGNLLDGYLPTISRDKQPLTMLVSSATQGETSQNLDGYRDYRGVTVIGAWKWDQDMQYGIATEIEKSEAYSTFYIIEMLIITVLVLTAFLSIALLLRMKLMEEKSIIKLSDSANRLSAVINNIFDGIITIDEKGLIDAVNPAVEYIFGYSADETIGQNIKMLMPESYHRELDVYLARQRTTGGKKAVRSGREVLGRCKDGSTFPIELSASKIMLDQHVYFVGVVKDITERKQVEQMQKEFISTVSHELRTPLTSIRGSLGLILGGVSGELPEKAKALLTIANNNSERLIHLINDILDMEKISAGKMQFDYTVANLLTVVQQAVESNKGYADQLHVSFELNSSPDNEIMVRIDEKRMAQVMSNLLSNAAKYSPTNDRVEISLEVAEKSVRISVHDHGNGIPEEFKSRIFSKFAQADSSDTRQKGGTGLGLNITKVIVEEHGGSIGFDSEAGKGTTFYVDIPLWHEERRVEKTRDEVVSDKPLVLIVEDDMDVSKLLSIMLEKEGCRCHQAFSYQEAVQQMRDNHYSAVTLDLIIPGGSGLSLLRELREDEATKNMPVIVVSGIADEGKLEVKGDALRMVDWIEKPIDENRLLEAIRSGLSDVKCSGRCILHVEDDPDIATIVDSLLGNECMVVHATTLEQARQLMKNEVYDLVLLDIGLPDGSGLDLLPELSEVDHQTPVIIFSAQNVSSDIATQVNDILVKSKTDNKQLIETIRSAINKKT